MRCGRWVVCGLPSLLVGGLLALPAAAAAAPGRPSAAAPAADEVEAAAAARAAGEPVEALRLRGEDRQVFANPDGSWTAEVTAGPVRVRRPDGSWSPVDTTLQVRPDGSVAPVAAVAGLVLSGGGTGPLVRLDRGSRSLSLSWPGSLPAPVLAGDTATYPEVLAGVDLQVRADVAGFAEQLVVKSAVAAANPALASLTFPLVTRGLSLRAEPDGSLRALDETGRPVFEAPQPMMWDSPAEPTGRGDGSGGGPGRTERPIAVSVTPAGLELTPDQEMLSGPDTTFPVVLDPTFVTYGYTARKEIDAHHPDSTTFTTVPAGNLAMGFQDFQPPTLARSFLAFGLSNLLWGSTISDAKLSLFEWWSASHDADCHIATRAQVWVTGGISAATTWNRQPTWGGLAAESDGAYGNDQNPSCAARNVEFPVTARVAAAAANHTGITFGIKASNESDGLGWRKFSGAADKVKLTVQYNHTPTVGSMTTTPSTAPACFFDASAPGGNSSTPLVNPGAPGMVLKANLADADQNHPGGHVESLRATFQLWRFGGSAPLWSKTVGPAAPGLFAAPAIRLFEPADPNNPDKVLRDQTVYNWKVNVTDGTATSAWSGWCQFKVDLSHPNTPGVAGDVYAPDSWSGGVGVPGLFTVDWNGSTDVTRFLYSFDTPTMNLQLTPGAGGTATAPAWSPPTQGIHHLYVRSVNRFGVQSTQYADYRFFVDPARDPVGRWKLDESGEATAAVDVGSGRHDAVVQGEGVTWGNGRVDGGVSFDGTPGSFLASQASVPTQAQFSVSAWVTLADTSLDFPVVGQGGAGAGDFLLGYCAGHWVFAVGASACGGAPPAAVVSASAPASSTWYHLAGVYDAAAARLRLYVNGVADGTPVTYAGSVTAAGTVQLGCAGCAGAIPGGELPWGLDDARVYDRILSAGEVAGIVNTAWQEVGRWAFDEASGASAADSSSNGYTGTLSGGAAFATGGHAGNAVSFGGSAPAVSTALPVLRLDRSFSVTAWVKLSTTTGVHTVLSQDGSATSGFALQYEPDPSGARWSFKMPNADATPPDYQDQASYVSTIPPTSFVHVAAVYDASSNQLKLYVGGQLHALGLEDQPWNASGVLQIGRDKLAGSYGNNWAGMIDDVHVYWGVVSEDLIRQQAGI
jgi:hypothetical protein